MALVKAQIAEHAQTFVLEDDCRKSWKKSAKTVYKDLPRLASRTTIEERGVYVLRSGRPVNPMKEPDSADTSRRSSMSADQKTRTELIYNTLKRNSMAVGAKSERKRIQDVFGAGKDAAKKGKCEKADGKKTPPSERREREEDANDGAEATSTGGESKGVNMAGGCKAAPRAVEAAAEISKEVASGGNKAAGAAAIKIEKVAPSCDDAADAVADTKVAKEAPSCEKAADARATKVAKEVPSCDKAANAASPSASSTRTSKSLPITPVNGSAPERSTPSLRKKRPVLGRVSTAVSAYESALPEHARATSSPIMGSSPCASPGNKESPFSPVLESIPSASAAESAALAAEAGAGKKAAGAEAHASRMEPAKADRSRVGINSADGAVVDGGAAADAKTKGPENGSPNQSSASKSAGMSTLSPAAGAAAAATSSEASAARRTEGSPLSLSSAPATPSSASIKSRRACGPTVGFVTKQPQPSPRLNSKERSTVGATVSNGADAATSSSSSKAQAAAARRRSSSATHRMSKRRGSSSLPAPLRTGLTLMQAMSLKPPPSIEDEMDALRGIPRDINKNSSSPSAAASGLAKVPTFLGRNPKLWTPPSRHGRGSISSDPLDQEETTNLEPLSTFEAIRNVLITIANFVETPEATTRIVAELDRLGAQIDSIPDYEIMCSQLFTNTNIYPPDSKTMKILQAVTQNMIFPAMFKFHTTMLKGRQMKDVRDLDGWKVLIEFGRNTSVTHRRWMQSLDPLDSPKYHRLRWEIQIKFAEDYSDITAVMLRSLKLECHAKMHPSERSTLERELLGGNVIL